MSLAKLFICDLKELRNVESLVKFSETLRDEVIVFSISGGEILCFSSVCPHMAGEIFFNRANNALHCKWHGLEFSEAGASTNCKGTLQLRKYKTEISEEKVFLFYEP